MPDDIDTRSTWTVHILGAPEHFRLSRKLIRLSGLPRQQLQYIFDNAPKSFELPALRAWKLVQYLKGCPCSFAYTRGSATHDSYNNVTGRVCMEAPMWAELAL